MNKKLATLTAVLLWPALSFADTPIKLVCNESGTTVFETQYGGPRYADSIRLQSFDGALVRSLLAAAERSYHFTDSELTASISVGKCVATPAGPTILTCEADSLPTGSSWIIANYRFAHFRNIGPGADFSESIQVQRPVIAKSLRLVVTKKRAHDPLLGRDYTAAHVKLVLSGQSPFGAFSLTEERTLGELVAEANLTPWGTCAFTK